MALFYPGWGWGWSLSSPDRDALHRGGGETSCSLVCAAVGRMLGVCVCVQCSHGKNGA